MPWNQDSDVFHDGLRRDPDGCGAGWARMAVALRTMSPVEARECAGCAVTKNPEAWRAWFIAFVAELETSAAA
jgi:hypothetical protein